MEQGNIVAPLAGGRKSVTLAVVRTIAIRRAEAGERDVGLIAPLFDSYRQFYDEPADAERAAAFIRERLEAAESAIFLAEAGGEGTTEALGFVQLYPSFSSVGACRIWVLNDLFVAPAARGSLYENLGYVRQSDSARFYSLELD